MKRSHFVRMIPLIAVLVSAMGVSVGFASWLATGGANAFALLTVQADGVVGESGQYLDVVTIRNASAYQYGTGYGFIDDGKYVNYVNLSGTCSFNATNGKSCFASFRNDKSFKLDIALSTELSGGFSSNSFTSDSLSLTSNNFTVANQDPVDGATITSTFVITCLSDAADFSFDFAIHLVWGGASLSGFPDMGGANIKIEFAPKENV